MRPSRTRNSSSWCSNSQGSESSRSSSLRICTTGRARSSVRRLASRFASSASKSVSNRALPSTRAWRNRSARSVPSVSASRCSFPNSRWATPNFASTCHGKGTARVEPSGRITLNSLSSRDSVNTKSLPSTSRRASSAFSFDGSPTTLNNSSAARAASRSVASMAWVALRMNGSSTASILTGNSRPSGPCPATKLVHSCATHSRPSVWFESTSTMYRLRSKASLSRRTKLSPTAISRESTNTRRPSASSRSTTLRTHSLSAVACERKRSNSCCFGSLPPIRFSRGGIGATRILR